MSLKNVHLGLMWNAFRRKIGLLAGLFASIDSASLS